MAVDVHYRQSSNEEIKYPIDWTNTLLTGVTVSSVAVTHTPPSGSAVTVTASVSSPLSYIPIPSGLAIGRHYFSCVATTSDSALSPEVRLVIQVDY